MEYAEKSVFILMLTTVCFWVNGRSSGLPKICSTRSQYKILKYSSKG